MQRWIINILGIDELQSMKREQLAAQASADEHLTILVKECPETVASALLLVRGVSRKQQARALSVPLTGLKEALTVEHEQSMFLYRGILQMSGDETCKCQTLKRLANSLDK
jgi:hypothetical protein